MKKLFTISFTFFAILFALNTNSQNFIYVTKSNLGQTISIATNQVLEVKLPCNPSTGYGWYATSIDTNLISQIGDEEFVPYSNNGMVGQPGNQITRFAGISQGTTNLKLEYKRPWEKNIAAIDVYTVTIVSEGKYTGSYTTPINQQSEQKHITSTPKSLPSSFSWQSQCTPIKNQAQCGSCWAFAACGVFEANINILDGVTKDLSEQWLINCDYSNNGCKGGTFPSVGDMFKNDGAVYESDLPYVNSSCWTTPGTDSICLGTCGTYSYHESIDSYAPVFGFPNPADADIKQAIYDYGPVWAGVYAGSDFQNYSGGIFSVNTGSQIDHAIVLVGWDDSGGYWILRNSWGPSWGENGYMRIAYGVSLVGTQADYIVYKGGPITTGCDTIFPPSAYISCFDNLTYYSAGSNGYVTGNNAYGDIEKAQKFIGTGGGEITSVYAYNILISGVSDDSYIELYSVDPITGSPDVFLGYSNTSAINTSGYTLYPFSSPVTVPSDFFASVVLPTNSDDTIAVASTLNGCYSGDSLAWEMWSDYTWHSIEHAWSYGYQIDLAIVPVLCNNTSSNPVVADFYATPTYICEGDAVNFYDLSSGSPTGWYWDFGDGNTSTSQDPSHTYNTAGTFTVSLTVTNATSSDTYTINNYITVNPLPSIATTPIGTTSLCQDAANTNYTTSGATYATSYVWNISPSGAGTISGTSTTGTVNWNASYTGTATISVYGVNSCGNGATSSSLSVTINPLPAQPTITPSGNLLTSSAASTYQWYYNGSIISGATSQSYTATQNGSYNVVVTNSYGCSNTSAPYNYNVTTAQPFVPELYSTAGDYFVNGNVALEWSIGESIIETNTGTNNFLTQGFHQSSYIITIVSETPSDDYTINVYPNPTSDNITIDFNSRSGTNLKLKLFDAQGKLLINEKAKSEIKTKILNLQNFSKGIYILNIYSDHGKLVKSYKIEKIN